MSRLTLYMASLFTNLMSLALTDPEIFLGLLNYKIWHVTLTVALLVIVCISRLGLVMFNLCTNFEVTTFTYYYDMNGDARCGNGMGC